jgi:predicted nucleic acid-binding protein
MSVVVDANLVVSMALPLPYSDQAKGKFLEWKHAGESLLAPVLYEYEIASAIRKFVAAGAIDGRYAQVALGEILALNIQTFPPSLPLHRSALAWAARLNQINAYDAQYLALAESMRLVLWTADRRLANCLAQIGIDWVRCIAEE